MKTAIYPYSLRVSEEDKKMMDYLKGRLGLGPAPIFRLGLRKLYRAEQAAHAAETLTSKHHRQLKQKGSLPKK